MSLQIVLNKDGDFEHPEYVGWVKDRVGVVLSKEDELILVLNDYSYSTIVHESIHVTQCVRDWACVKDDETHAYLVEWCFNEVCKLITKNKLSFD